MHNSIFEKIKHIDEKGNEYWYARELQNALGYKEWRKFEGVIDKAIIACKCSNINDFFHFVGADKLSKRANNAEVKIKDYRLSRYACYLIAQNGDSRKQEISLAQTYFAVQTRKQEIIIKKHISKSVHKGIDKVLTNINERNPVRLRDYTPAVLVDNGVRNLPMYENPVHIRKNILTKEEAKELGLKINSKDNYHGLGKDLYIKVIDSLDNPRVIFKNKNDGNQFLILTMIKDSNKNNIIVPIEIETKTKVNNLLIDINRIKTVYGYDRTNPDLNKYIKDNINSNKLEKIYEYKKDSSTNITSQLNPFNNSNISQNKSNVNSGVVTKHSMQKL